MSSMILQSRTNTLAADAVPAMASVATAAAAPRPLPQETQRGDFLCWAALSVSFQQVVHPGSVVKQQCDIVMETFTQVSGCCGSERVPQHCDLEATLPEGMARVGIAVAPTGGSMSVGQVEAALANGPIACMITFPGSGPNHFVGVDAVIGSMFAVMDPARSLRFDMDTIEFTTDYARAGGVWRDTFLI